MPNLAWAISCDYAFDDEHQKACIIGVFERIWADSFPATHPFFFVVSQWAGDPGETFNQHTRIVGPDGSEVAQTTGVRATTSPVGAARVNSKFVGVTFPQAGDYRIEFLADDDVIGSISLTLAPRYQPSQEGL